MDLLKILKEAISSLPAGDHMAGLNSIARHVSVAIRHYQDGGQDPHSDRFTDAIYRTNQAYEGSLKEAYRVLAGKDPGKRTPNEIEAYLEKHEILRPRVLTQIARYRQDYRNPSAHDHKLDFDQNEALLAIMSTCSFAKLLVDQIHERLYFDKAKSESPDTASRLKGVSNPIDLAMIASELIKEFLDKNEKVISGHALTGSLSGVLSSAGFAVSNDQKTSFGDTWDIFLKHEDASIPIEVRSFGSKFDADDTHGLGYLEMCMSDMTLPVGINVINASESDRQSQILRSDFNDHTLLVVTQYSGSEISTLESGIVFEPANSE